MVPSTTPTGRDHGSIETELGRAAAGDRLRACARRDRIRRRPATRRFHRCLPSAPENAG